MQEQTIQIDVSESNYWNGKGTMLISGTLAELKKMILASVNAQNSFAEGLSDWLRHDTWTQDEGLILLLGLDPRGTIIEPSNWVGMKNERLDEIAQAKFLDGRNINLAIWHAIFNHLKPNDIAGIDDKLSENVKRELWDLSESYRKMKVIFESGGHPVRNKPDFYVQWALDKKFKVPWIEEYKKNDKFDEGNTVTTKENDSTNNETSPLGGTNFTKALDEIAPQPQVEINSDRLLSELFDAVPLDALEKMFPANGQWKKWGERAARNGLSKAREGRAKFNPYKAAIWFMQNGNQGWDLARCYRVLKNNLPIRSKYKADLLESIDDK